MLTRPLLRRFLPILTAAACGLLLPASALAMIPWVHGGPAAASGSHGPARHRVFAPMIAAPVRTVVSGSIRFTALRVAPSARRVVFSIDGRPLWATTKPPFRFRRTGLLNTTKLANGRHILRVAVYFGGRLVRATQKTVVVHNFKAEIARRREKKRKRGPAGSGSATSGKSGATGTSSGTSKAGTTGAPPRSTPGAPGASASAVANFNREDYQWSSALPMSQEANRYQILVLSAWEYPEVPLLRAANPHLKLLMYDMIDATNSEDPSFLQTDSGCTSYSDDVANHPDWFLHDAGGKMALNRGYTSAVYLNDVGNAAYLQQCAANAISVAKRYGFDGVFWDQVEDLPWLLPNGVQVPEYAATGSWDAAMTSAVGYLSSQLDAQGLLSVGNVATQDDSTWRQWATDLDGVEEESWTDGGEGLAQQVPYFAQKLADLAFTQTHGKYEILHSYNGGEEANTYGLAAMLLAAGGTASYSTSNTDYVTNENWFPEYTTAESLGAPTGTYTVLPNGVYERQFAGGIVLVNPSASSVSSFDLGATYSGTGLSHVSSVSMAPTSGLILLNG